MRFIILFLFAIQWMACVNLKNVNGYCTRSVSALSKFEELSSTFQSVCEDNCLILQLKKGKLEKDACDCKPEARADSVTQVLYETTLAYYEAMEKLSGGKLTQYNWKPVSKSLTSGEFGGITIEKEQVEAATRMASILSRLVTDGYRRRKITQYVGESNEPVQGLLKKLQFTLQRNLVGKLKVEHEFWALYYEDLFNDSSFTSAFDRKKIIEEYHALKAGMSGKMREVEIYSKGLSRLAKGHQELYEKRNKMTKKEMVEFFLEQGQELRQVMIEFRKLKNEK